MNPVEHIRTSVFDCKTQTAFAEVLGVTQATVSRWEAAKRIPGPKQELVRREATKRGAWNDNWFFAVPAEARPEQATADAA